MKYQKPEKYNFFRHLGYALAGFKNMVKEERAARIHVVAFVVLSIGLLFVPFSGVTRWVMFCSMFLVLIGEAVNTAVERVVDLCSPEYAELAGEAKDVAALVVLLCFVLTGLIWVGCVWYELKSLI